MIAVRKLETGKKTGKIIGYMEEPFIESMAKAWCSKHGDGKYLLSWKKGKTPTSKTIHIFQQDLEHHQSYNNNQGGSMNNEAFMANMEAIKQIIASKLEIQNSKLEAIESHIASIHKSISNHLKSVLDVVDQALHEAESEPETESSKDEIGDLMTKLQGLKSMSSGDSTDGTDNANIAGLSALLAGLK